MDTTVTEKPNLAKKAVSAVRRHERKILITVSVVSTVSAVVMRTGIAQHNDFLRERGLFDEFYALDEA